jgi:hypothetical protein
VAPFACAEKQAETLFRLIFFGEKNIVSAEKIS